MGRATPSTKRGHKHAAKARKSPQKSRLVKRLDAAWSKAVRIRSCCEKCGKPDRLQGAHIIGRLNRRLRWDLRNGISLCVGCHLFWAHKEPIAFTDWIREWRSKDVAYVESAQKEITHYAIEDLVELLRILENVTDAESLDTAVVLQAGFFERRAVKA